jgi:hypothetical protein
VADAYGIRLDSLEAAVREARQTVNEAELAVSRRRNKANTAENIAEQATGPAMQFRDATEEFLSGSFEGIDAHRVAEVRGTSQEAWEACRSVDP